MAVKKRNTVLFKKTGYFLIGDFSESVRYFGTAISAIFLKVSGILERPTRNVRQCPTSDVGHSKFERPTSDSSPMSDVPSRTFRIPTYATNTRLKLTRSIDVSVYFE